MSKMTTNIQNCHNKCHSVQEIYANKKGGGKAANWYERNITDS